MIRVDNQDPSPYKLVLGLGDPAASPLGWTIGVNESGLIDLPAAFAAQLQVRSPNCDAIQAWTVDPGSYVVRIVAGDAFLEPVSSPLSATPFPSPSISECIFNGS